MCVIERRSYVLPNGRRETVETANKCSRSRGSLLCSRVERRDVDVDERPTNRRDGDRIITIDISGRQRVYRDLSSRSRRERSSASQIPGVDPLLYPEPPGFQSYHRDVQNQSITPDEGFRKRQKDQRLGTETRPKPAAEQARKLREGEKIDMEAVRMAEEEEKMNLQRQVTIERRRNEEYTQMERERAAVAARRFEPPGEDYTGGKLSTLSSIPPFSQSVKPSFKMATTSVPRNTVQKLASTVNPIGIVVSVEKSSYLPGSTVVLFLIAARDDAQRYQAFEIVPYDSEALRDGRCTYDLEGVTRAIIYAGTDIPKPHRAEKNTYWKRGMPAPIRVDCTKAHEISEDSRVEFDRVVSFCPPELEIADIVGCIHEQSRLDFTKEFAEQCLRNASQHIDVSHLMYRKSLSRGVSQRYHPSKEYSSFSQHHSQLAEKPRPYNEQVVSQGMDRVGIDQFDQGLPKNDLQLGFNNMAYTRDPSRHSRTGYDGNDSGTRRSSKGPSDVIDRTSNPVELKKPDFELRARVGRSTPPSKFGHTAVIRSTEQCQTSQLDGDLALQAVLLQDSSSYSADQSMHNDILTADSSTECGTCKMRKIKVETSSKCARLNRSRLIMLLVRQEKTTLPQL